MNYEQKYKEALERAKDCYVNKKFSELEDTAQQLCEYIFPELRESEDERIRRCIGVCLTDVDEQRFKDFNTNLKDCLNWLEKQSGIDNYSLEYSTNTVMTDSKKNQVEPKFKVGDWIVNDYCMGRVVELTNDAYLLDTEQGIPFSCKHNVHLWIIQDAKEGDVLATKNSVFIFKHMDKAGLSLCRSYCEVIDNSKLGFGFDFSINGVHPATQEQHDLLFQKIHEAGYIWDPEKKELKKIEQNLAWSEEDEEKFNSIIEVLGEDSLLVNWLKSLKDRVQPQPNQECSEEDSKIAKELIRYLPYCDDISKDTKEKWISWLKSLKPNHWKPSEQNINDLEWCADLVKDKMGVGFHRLQVR